MNARQMMKQSVWKGVPLVPVIFAAMALAGCSSVALAPPQEVAVAKTFPTPPEGKAGLYLYRDTFMGQSIKRDLAIDGKCIGKTANKTFFYLPVAGNQQHMVTTEGETARRSLPLYTEAGKNYFVEQVITMGMWSANAKLKQASKEEGEKEVRGLDMAAPGDCS